MEYSKENLLDVIRVLFKWKKPIIITCISVAVLAAVISLLVPVYFTATTIFYPASPSLQSPSVVFGETKTELYFYGGSADTDRLLQAARSNELYDYMINTFNLYGHYDIDSTGSKASYKVREKLSKRYELVKNERDAVELSITDKNAELSAKMANAARMKINEIANNLIKQSQKDILLSFETQIKDKEQMLAVISDSLSFLQNKYGIYDAFTTKKMIGSAIPNLKSGIVSEKARLESYKASGGKRDSIRTIQARIIGMEKKLESYTQGEFGEGLAAISRIDKLGQTEQQLMRDLTIAEGNYRKYLSAFSVPKPAMFVQDEAEKPVIKSWPKRSYMVLSAVFLAFIFAILGVLLLEYNRDVDWKSIINSK